jgi:outer membrane lipoprotein carrier protein
MMLLALAALPLGLAAQTQSAATLSVHAVAQLVDHHYNQLHSLRAEFSESYEGLGLKKTESGTLLLLKPGRMRWDYSSPAGKLFLIDGKYAWFYVRGAAEVQRIPAAELNDFRSPLRFLLGHTQLEKEMTGLHLAEQSGGHGECTLIGQPKGQQNRVRHITLTVVEGSGTITAIAIEETDGTLTRFSFNNEQMNVPIPESAFHYTPPAGLPVVDSLKEESATSW